MRAYITRIIAILVVVGAVYGKKLIEGSKEKKKPVTTINTPTATITTAKNSIVPVNIIESGLLSAKYKIDLFSEVQGVMESTSKEFKPGATFKKGAVLVKIKSADYYANLQAQKSVLQNLITSILPDIKLDYPEVYAKWDTYLKNFDMNTPLTDLPNPGTDKEKFFLTGKNLYTTYYNTRNLEIVYLKYTLTAPYNGILTEALVTPGSLIRNGQKLGEFIDPTQYELELSISRALIESVVIGNEVVVHNPENPAQKWMGKVSRINGKVNTETQTIQVFVELNKSNLKEGLYLEALIAGQGKSNAIELPRNSLVDGNQVYVINADTTLKLQQIEVVHKTRETIIVQGIEDQTLILQKPIPGAYVGMKVLIKK
ncbi:MAG: membrane fusion protein (multidrug efflux system) [Salibacteraceae bacterium]|jgi:multidrug efflux pump subunit AcrA (membrane-fusion protein)